MSMHTESECQASDALDVLLERALRETERQRRDVAGLQRPRLVHGRDGRQVALHQRQQHLLADGARQDDRELGWIAERLEAQTVMSMTVPSLRILRA